MSEYPKLIGLTGYAGAGKDLVAALLKMAGYTRFGFADKLRREIEESYDTPPCFPEHILADWLLVGEEDEGALWKKPMSQPARRLAQWFGTEYRRAQDSEYWIKALQKQIMPFTRNPIVISDVRFLNEAEWIEKWDGIIWRIERPGLASDGHQSESESNLIKADYVIKNDGDLQHLANQVLTALEVFRDGSETTKSACD